MTTPHLLNTCRWLQRLATDGVVVRGCLGINATFDDYGYDEDCVYGTAALKLLNYAPYKAELEKRGLIL